MQYTDCNKKERVTKLLHFAYTTDLKRPGQITLRSLSKSHLDVTSVMYILSWGENKSS